MKCCAKPLTRIIKVGNFEAGLMGLDDALGSVMTQSIGNEDELARTLLEMLKKSGNYIAPSKEEEYKAALLREYKAYRANAERQRVS